MVTLCLFLVRLDFNTGVYRRRENNKIFLGRLKIFVFRGVFGILGIFSLD